jgi:type II secretory pathway component GspD/PulD (secretin)
MFDYDINSNSLIVVNATPRQMYDIEQAVEMYDLPTEYDESLMLKRRVELVRIKYSRASTIAAAVKDAYRDLLSQTDEAFQTNNGGEENGSRATTSSKRAVWSVIHYGGPGDGSPGAKKTPQVPTKFDGALSIGVDDVANVIIVSARDELFDSVRTLIAQLDEEARPQTTVAVHRLGNSMKSEELQSTLAQILGQPWVGNRPDPAAQQQQRGGDDRRRREEWRRRNRGRGDRGGGNRN